MKETVCVVLIAAAGLAMVETAILSVNPIFVVGEEKIPQVVRKVANPTIIKVGQVWAIKDDNPFKKHRTAAHVVAIKSGYIKYYFAGQENYGEWAVQSDTAATFASVFTEKVK